jgi:hypothetical protein
LALKSLDLKSVFIFYFLIAGASVAGVSAANFSFVVAARATSSTGATSGATSSTEPQQLYLYKILQKHLRWLIVLSLKEYFSSYLIIKG